MSNFVFKGFSLLKWFFLFLLLIFLSGYFILRGSLPDLDGKKTITLLEQSLTIERDAQGIPTIRAQSRSDTAFALGYVHAQERYFQMDLLRRKAAGELSGLFGNKLMDKDKKIKIHRFKERAKQILRHLPKTQYRILQAYTNGVNSGVEILNNEPYQYLLLGQVPRPWELEDSLLCIFAMYFDLNDERGERKTSLAVMRDTLPPQWFDFLTPEGGQWDATMDTAEHSESKNKLLIPETNLPVNFFTRQALLKESEAVTAHNENDSFLPGSNSMVIDSSLTHNASAMLANDMHLTLRVPNIWYRASWFLADGRRINGVTLPGTPVMVVGSNEKIAWGFTNSYGDLDEVITLKTNADNTRYFTEQGWQDFTIYNHVIESNTGMNNHYISIETIWGPVIGSNHQGELLAHQWVAYSPQSVNMNLFELEKAGSVNEALTITPGIGIPPQNIVLADHEGNIAWTVAGVIPDRDSSNQSDEIKPASQGWQSYLAVKDYPLLMAPENHRIWTANNRLFSGKKLAAVGFEGGDLGARAQQIRDNLLAQEKFQESDLLAIQLDNRGIFLQRWKQLLADSLKVVNSLEPINNLEAINSTTESGKNPENVTGSQVEDAVLIVSA
ncbi:MAG: penicillin acylase family protein [gamma proteobacterium symbiont of Bathyaustriella thionipta]|nr:penicillin acylase family protein [gamma proteobacterium symbiont of Bathyaustriella thionipta]MCU7950827.1 penicillin acylase family protein [gamma proteobacterium symbiont of Bathyaustriella thionipta]MCU7952050.1 penicillin acylase family protein [gamma proteobacterium symbiont of Bathyaustriella thionipta]MCU7957339.1 penicillin acylase family protein [gamma proteobacterium symbiont of Bathyaustriella thionipta]MCU7967401.1 penicillin acylase family protein [gamma proteobacterium symbion